MRTLASIAILTFLLIKVDLAVCKKDENTGLVQLAQKDFGAFMHHAAESASKVNRASYFKLLFIILDF